MREIKINTVSNLGGLFIGTLGTALGFTAGTIMIPGLGSAIGAVTGGIIFTYYGSEYSIKLYQ